MSWSTAALLAGLVGLSFTACGGTSELRPISDSNNGGEGGSAGSRATGGAGGGGSGGEDAVGGSGGDSGSRGDGGTGGFVQGTGGVGAGGSSGGSGGSGGTTVEPELGRSIFVLDGLSGLADATFFDHPWPSDARRNAQGAVLLEGYPNPLDGELINGYLMTMEGRLDGFSPVAAGYLRFTVPLHPDSLPRTIPASAAAASPVQLIDIEPNSPEFGERRQIAVSFRAEPGVYVPENTLSFAPAFGQPLRPETRYALVVTSDVRDSEGQRLEPAPTLSALLDEETPTGGDDYADALLTLAELGIYEEILHLAVFTTSDPTREAMSIRDATLESFPAPSATGWTAQEQVTDVYDVYEGTYGPSPDYQAGTPPFGSVNDGGDVRYDAEGIPIVQREFDLRFALAVPDATECPEPSAGYPVVLIAHGTGGNFRSAFGTDAEATLFAEQCLATLSIDQIFHGNRPGAGLSSELLYFNLENPIAARANGPQSAVDFVQLARLVTEGGFSVPSGVSRTGQAIAFDPERVLFFGHSQGGLNGPIFLASDDQALGGVMSGAAATVTIALLDKTAPLAFAPLLALLLGLEGDEALELDEFHPALSLAQTIADPSDGINYARHALLEPRAGFNPKSLLMTEGVRADGSGDSYAPPRGIEALAAAIGLPTRLPQLHASPFADWLGLQPLDVSSQGVSGNLAGGFASGVLTQYDADLASDGHFVAYQVEAARNDVARFLRNLADEPEGRVPGG